MSKCGPSWRQALVLAVLWVATVALFAIPLAWMIIVAATQIPYRAFTEDTAAPGVHFIAFCEFALLACLLIIVPFASGPLTVPEGSPGPRAG